MTFSLSPEQTKKLETYVALLKKWQKTINLVSKNTLDEAWERHILDSAQLEPHIPQNRNILDFGSGAGFPGLVLAILRPDLNITLIESDSRKCAFLSNVSRETSASVTIINERIENVSCLSGEVNKNVSRETSVDMITARAVASVQKLLAYAAPFVEKNPNVSLLLLKGARAEEEIAEAQKTYDFEVEQIQSQTEKAARILKIKKISHLRSKPHVI